MTTTNNKRFAIIVHGGVGPASAAQAEVRTSGCREAAMAGYAALQRGRSGVDAVEVAVRVMEDDPCFNAGRGSTLNSQGKAELDASIMDGSTLQAGAAAALQHIRNPISLARKVMDESSHVLLVAAGAERFAQLTGAEFCTPDELIVPHQRSTWESEHGTVGCVALDQYGHIVAGTSTGGTFNALPGRVGDSALIGCGTYASQAGGVSCTGLGEAIIRTTLGRFAVDLLEAGGEPQAAADQSVAELQSKTEGDVGLILIDREGRTGFAHNGAYLPICMIDPNGTLHAAA